MIIFNTLRFGDGQIDDFCKGEVFHNFAINHLINIHWISRLRGLNPFAKAIIETKKKHIILSYKDNELSLKTIVKEGYVR